jgi:hypothetical protein
LSIIRLFPEKSDREKQRQATKAYPEKMQHFNISLFFRYNARNKRMRARDTVTPITNDIQGRVLVKIENR